MFVSDVLPLSDMGLASPSKLWGVGAILPTLFTASWGLLDHDFLKSCHGIGTCQL